MSGRREFHDLVSPERVREVLAGFDVVPDPETVPLDDARGRVLAERVDAAIDVPGFDRASMDGYAVRARDTFGADESDPVELDVVAEVHAGTVPGVSVESGTAVEISTGAVVPSGADAVVMVERTTASDDGTDDRVQVRSAVAPGDNVMLAGADIAAGTRALGPGTLVTAREVGLLSALGMEHVPVRGRPRVGILSTGDELVRPGGDLDSAAGQIYDVNSFALAASVEEAGGEPILLPHAGDDTDEMERLLVRGATECDLVLSSGSTSASAVDVVYRVVEARGELLIHGVAVKPGKPMLVGRIEDSAYVGLPGYPVSALTIFRTFVAPVVRRAAGLPEPRTEHVAGEMAHRERFAQGRLRLMPVGLVEAGDGTVLVHSVDKGSGATTSLVEADGIVSVPPDTDYLAAGEPVDVQLFSPDVRPPTLLGVGEDDPVLARVLDGVDRPRYLPIGTRDGLRRLRDGLPDVAVTAGPLDGPPDAEELGSWRREWGLVVPAGDPHDVSGLADLVDRDLRFVNRDRASGLRTSLERSLDGLAEDRGVARGELASTIDGFGLTTKAHESPARKVAAGAADVGLGLRSTSEALGLSFVSIGTQDVRVFANPTRTEKAGVRDLEEALLDLDAIVSTLAGYSV